MINQRRTALIFLFLAGVALLLGPLALQAQDRMPAAQGHSSGVVPHDVAPAPELPAAPEPLAPALLTHVYGDENVASQTSFFFIWDAVNIMPIAPYILTEFPGAGAFGPDPDFFYALSGLQLDAVDVATGMRTLIGSLPPPPGYPIMSFTGMTFDTITGTMYLASCDIDTSFLYTLDVNAATWNLIGEITNSPCSIALAADPGGNLFTYDIVTDSGLFVDKFSGEGIVLGPIGFNANFGQGMEYDPSIGAMVMTAFNADTFQAELRFFNTFDGSSNFISTIGFGGGDLRQFGYAAIPQDYFTKTITSGNDFDFNGVPDRVIDIDYPFPLIFEFEILYNKPQNPPVSIKDVVPNEWDVDWVGGNTWCEIVRANERRNLFSDNHITCYPPPGQPASMYFRARTRCDTPACDDMNPTECGAFILNEGAGAYFGRLRIDQTDGLCLAAVRDLNGFGLVYDGTGDEDNDGVDDYTEACINFTDPCDAGSNAPSDR